MNLGLYLAFLAASTVLIIMPGPVVALVAANSLTRGRRYGLITVAGAASATVIQLTAVALGMASVLGTLGVWFDRLRWLGVAYLVYLAWKAFTARPAEITAEPPAAGGERQAFLRGFLVSLTNPKTLFFYGAFLPQFLDPNAPIPPQALLLTTSFFVIAIVSDSAWALAAARFRGVFTGRGQWLGRISGAVYLTAGAGLAAARTV